MSLALTLLRELRLTRRQTIRALAGCTQESLASPMGPGRPADVRAALLALAQDDDRRATGLAAGLRSGYAWTEARATLRSLALTRGELRAALVGLTDDLLDRAPSPGEWTVRETLRHVANNEERFAFDVQIAVASLRGSLEPWPQREDARRPGTLGPDLPGGLDLVLEALDRTREAVLLSLVGLSHAELGAPLEWAGRTVEVRFMLARRASHERQHTVQLRRALTALGFVQSEAQMILGQAETARSQLEGLVAGLPDSDVGSAVGEGATSLGGILIAACEEESVAVRAMLT
jgi:hypothetical protein